MHLGVCTDLAHDLGQEVEGDGRAVELAAAVIGERDAIDAQVGELLRVGDGLHALDDELARPLLLDPGEVLVGDGGVEHEVEQLGDSAVPAAEARERERLGGQEVPPPPGAGYGVGDRAAGARRRRARRP